MCVQISNITITQHFFPFYQNSTVFSCYTIPKEFRKSLSHFDWKLISTVFSLSLFLCSLFLYRYVNHWIRLIICVCWNPIETKWSMDIRHFRTCWKRNSVENVKYAWPFWHFEQFYWLWVNMSCGQFLWLTHRENDKRR